MANDASIRAFKCPTCGAPLEPESGALTMKCGYCGSSVIIPQSLRTPPSSSSNVPQYTWGGIDLTAMVGEAMRLPEVLSMAESGRLDEAAQLYSQITGLSHTDALKSVQSMAAGQAVTLIPGTPGASFQQMQTPFTQSTFTQPGMSSFNGQTIDSTSGPRASGSGCGRIILGVMVATILLVVGLAVVGFFLFSNNTSTNKSSSNPLGQFLPLGFANSVLTFGSEGIGSGMFQDPRAIGVDGNGNMVVADFKNGRIQTFDPNGKFISTFTVTDDKGKSVNADSIAVGQDGKIYIPNGKILVYDETGKQLSQFGDENHFYENLTMGQDGTLYALTFGDNNLVHFKRDGSIDFEIPDPISAETGSSGGFPKLAVDGLGNIYIANDTPPVILKFSPQGKYINQFGGETKDASTFEAGKFVSPESIAIDGYGRVFVDDFFNIQVFDSTGAYLNNISGSYSGITFDSQNNMYATSSNNHNVTKFQIQKPSGQ